MVSGNKVVGPVELPGARNGKPLFAFNEVDSFNDMKLDYTT